MQRVQRTFFVVALSCLLGACGFQLRGSGGSSLPESWYSMHLLTGNPNSELSREIESSFAASGINWVERENANYIVKVTSEKFEQRNLSINAQARAAEFELTLSTQFSVLNAQGKTVMPLDKVSILKEMENDPRNVVGKAEEMRILRSEMRSEMVRQMMRRIAYFAASTQ